MTRRERKQPESRRRTGCWTCKEKHVQCTEEQPRCSRCERLNLDCARGIRLLWKEDAAQRGIHFGREGTWSKRCPKIKKPPQTDIEREFRGVPTDQYADRWIFLNTTYWDFGYENGKLEDRSQKLSALTRLAMAGSGHNSSRLSVPGALSHPLSSYPQIEGYLLNYFIQAIGPSCSLSPSYNPYLSLVTPIALSLPTLKNTLLAISANQLQLLGDRRFVNEAYMYNQRALKGLQDEINDKKPSYGAVATVLMLCFHDITDGCSPSWMTHLHGGLQLIDLLSSKDTESHLFKKFFVMYFVAHDIMGRTASEDPSLAESGSHGWLEDDDLEEIDMLMGCSRGLMTLISKISSLASEKAKISKRHQLTASESSYFAAARNDIEASLQVLRQTLPSFAADQEDLLRIAETKRLTALLFLRERLGNPTISANIQPNDIPLYDSTPNPNAIVPGAVETSLSACKGRLVSAIISLISTLPDSATLLWPLFVVGNVGLDDEEQRRFVLERLEGIQKTRNLGSVRRARMVVEDAYRARDLDHPRGKVWGHEGPGIISLA